MFEMSWISEIPTRKAFLAAFRRDPHLIYLQGCWEGRVRQLSCPAVAELAREFYVTGPNGAWMVSIAATGRQLSAIPIKIRQGVGRQPC
jgi:hypothetical protein